MKCWHHSRDENTSEKQSLRGHAPKWSVPCILHSRRALAFCTRLVFTVTIFTGFGVIFASIWFMLDCRQNFKSIQAIIPRHSSFCTNLGMQALFACCVLLFTIFGLGCIGRRMTGHAILIISGVAIFQGAMTLVFYQCRAMADEDIVKAVNSTLVSCRVGIGYSPFALSSSGIIVPVDKVANEKRTQAPIATAAFQRQIPETISHDEDGDGFHDAPSTFGEEEIQIEPKVNSSWHNIVQLSQELKRKLEYSMKTLGRKETPKAAQLISIPLQSVECDENSAYFVALAKKHDKKDVNMCRKVCKTYREFCLGRDISVDRQIAIETVVDIQGRNDVPKVEGEFQNEALTCGEKIADYVRHFCIYDNRIFTPLSLGTPIFYMFMSFGLIYLAHCDRQIKDDDILDNPGDLKPGSRSSSKSSRRSNSKGKEKRESGYSSSSPFRRQQQEENSMPSPALSDVSSNWGGNMGLGRDQFLHESDASPRLSLHSSSARTLDTVLGDD